MFWIFSFWRGARPTLKMWLQGAGKPSSLQAASFPRQLSWEQQDHQACLLLAVPAMLSRSTPGWSPTICEHSHPRRELAGPSGSQRRNGEGKPSSPEEEAHWDLSGACKRLWGPRGRKANLLWITGTFQPICTGLEGAVFEVMSSPSAGRFQPWLEGSF